MIDERTEQLINRKLDGELTEAESLELDKLLLRSPEARALLAEYERHDTLAGEALRGALAGASRTAPQARQLIQAAARRRVGRHLVQGVAIAATVALAVVAGGYALNKRGPAVSGIVDDPVGTPTVLNVDEAEPAPAVPYTTLVIEGPRRREQRFDRDIFGVFDETTQSLYLLEANQSQTRVVPVSMNY